MKFRSLFTLVALMLFASLSAQTTAERAGNRAKNRAENRANSNVDRKVDKAVDGAFNAVGNLFKKKKKKKGKSGEATDATEQTQSDQAGMDAIANLMGGKSKPWTPYTNPVSFSVRMEMTEEKKNGKTEAVVVEMAVTSDRYGIRLQGEETQETTRMILNTQDGKTTMISTDKKGEQSAFRLRMPGAQGAVAESVSDVTEGITIEETNETRVIDGYNCRKYIMTDSKRGTTTESWVTTDANISAQDVFSGMVNAFGAKAPKQATGGPSSAMARAYEGFPILSISNDGKSTYTTRFKDLKVGASEMDGTILNLEGIQVQELGF